MKFQGCSDKRENENGVGETVIKGEVQDKVKKMVKSRTRKKDKEK